MGPTAGASPPSGPTAASASAARDAGAVGRCAVGGVGTPVTGAAEGSGAAGVEEAGAVGFAAEVADGACEVEVVLPVGVRPAVAIYSDHAQATASIRAYRVRGRAPARRAAR